MLHICPLTYYDSRILLPSSSSTVTIHRLYGIEYGIEHVRRRRITMCTRYYWFHYSMALLINIEIGSVVSLSWCPTLESVILYPAMFALMLSGASSISFLGVYMLKEYIVISGPTILEWRKRVVRRLDSVLGPEVFVGDGEGRNSQGRCRLVSFRSTNQSNCRNIALKRQSWWWRWWGGEGEESDENDWFAV